MTSRHIVTQEHMALGISALRRGEWELAMVAEWDYEQLFFLKCGPSYEETSF